jgi:predicted Rossmann fold flavoprotein
MKQQNIKQHLILNKIAIIGGGSSGLFCAILLAKKGFTVTIFEKNHKAGRKLLATGNGKCNISNTNLSLEFFHSNNFEYYKKVIENFGFEKFNELVSSFGLDTIIRGTKVYPASDQASSVVDVLYNEALHEGVKFFFDSEIIKIEKNNQFTITSHDKQYKFDKVILASGSGAMKKLGSSDSGYQLAKNLGHNIIEPIASLVQLESDNEAIKKLHGLKCEAKVTLLINNQKTTSKYGDILFAKYGVSGNTILDLSREASLALKDYQVVDIVVDIFPKIDKNKLLANLEKKYKQIVNKQKEFLLLSLVNSKIIEYIFEVARIKQDKVLVSDLNKKDLQALVYTMKNMKISITASRGYEYAEVVSGGIDTKDIDEISMESKLVKDLYFIGEVVDVDGDCGGYNLHWAWASAYSLAQNLK